MKRAFLTAEWKDLVMINYTIDPEILTPYLPKGTKLDLFENKCYISLVSFLFQNTKVLGTKIPFHNNFEEVNLRFYVKYYENGIWKRGVVFIKEIVPKLAITFIANTLYKENYSTAKMNHFIKFNKANRTLHYKWKVNKKWQGIAVKTSLHPKSTPPKLVESFITEHYYGYTKNYLKTYEYEVQHSTWELYDILDYQINVDFSLNYEQNFTVLNHLNPTSVLVAKGSEIKVLNKRRIQ